MCITGTNWLRDYSLFHTVKLPSSYHIGLEKLAKQFHQMGNRTGHKDPIYYKFPFPQISGDA